MTADLKGMRSGMLAALVLALATGMWAQSTGQSTGSSTTPSSAPTAQPAPGTTPVGGDSPAPPAAQQPGSQQSGSQQPNAPQSSPQQPNAGSSAPSSTPSTTTPSAQPAPGTTPVGSDIPPPSPDTKSDSKSGKKPAPGTTPVGGDQDANVKVDADKVVDPGSQMIKFKPGSIEDVSAVGNRDIGARGIGNWYSTDTEIKMGKQYADEIEKSARFITDPQVEEYVNRIGQNIVKNSDCKVPFTIKVIDSDEINAFALPGGFFYVNSGLILNADEEAELAGVMAHETAHVCAHHAAREMTRLNYAQLSTIPLLIVLGGSWTGYGIYEAAQLAIPITFLQFSRDFEAQADYLGVQYMYRAGYDPQALHNLL